ncbi:leucine-rich repeat-containing protein 56 isoform X2 [Lepisosteus oculatus]|uniref:leucine-rich repeat-containing protein 56 isoform X2 n=1 Tax=Lepisosteus oculatus TaxID=7918 RepID=UPI0035F51A80
MQCSQDPFSVVRPSTARIWVTEFAGSGQLNPSPAAYEDAELLVEQYLSQEKLQAITGTSDLEEVKVLEICVDTRENTLGNFGTYLPSLIQLKMNNSLIVSVRDLGTTLSHLQVLWMARCGLLDLDGIPSFCSLKELYLAYNDISDLSQVSMLDNLEILDLEGNNIDDITQVQYLGLCCRLTTLTLEGNPVCSTPHPDSGKLEQYCYRGAVKELVPQLKYLDDIPADDKGLLPPSTPSEDWVIVKDSIKDSTVAQDLDIEEEAVSAVSGGAASALRPLTGRPSSALRPWAAPWPVSAGRPGSARPLSSPGSRPGSSNSDPASLEQDASDLTHGVGRVICGNPVRALCARKQKLNLAPSPQLSPFAQHKHIPEHTYDTEASETRDREDVFAELRAWRKEHNKRLEAIQKEREPQVLKISHSSYEEEEGHSLGDSSEEEEIRGAWSCNGTNSASPDSSFQSPGAPSPPPGGEVISHEDWSHSVSPDPLMGPSPPPPRTVPPAAWRLSDMRARRLRTPVPSQELESSLSCSATRAFQPDEEFPLLGPERGRSDSEVVKPKIRPELKAAEAPDCSLDVLRPVSGPAAGGSRNQSSATPRNSQKSIDGHQPIIRSSAKTPEKPVTLHAVRPFTAKATLQRLPSRPAVLPARGGAGSS